MVELYRSILRPLLFRLDAEESHRLAFKAMRAANRLPLVKRAIARQCRYRHPSLICQRFGQRFPNPLGLAAGFDKNAELVTFWSACGFGFVELGTITAVPQPGNDKPRLFRLPADRALINRMGFNNDGAEVVAARLRKLSPIWPARPLPIGINIGKSKVAPLEAATDDYLASLRALVEFADYLVINVSSPNTPGLRELQQRDELERLLGALRPACRQTPLLVKIAPELNDEQLADVVELARAHGLDGIIATNTTTNRANLQTEEIELVGQVGGLSGRPLKERSLRVIATLYRLSKGELPIIGVGGLFDGNDAYDAIRAGASLVQLYTGFVYGGPLVVRQILKQLVARLRADGYEHIDEAIGVDAAESSESRSSSADL
ncbi:MAG: quinone-dependent dihydroorotate dehydrogenase [Myxococcales bacterium]|nr:quinone-dependent dihydroorotate dehydrogenase [Myxococcales bacterium]